MKQFQVGESQNIRRDTVTSHVYGVIRQNIMALELSPGQMLNEKEFAAELGVSRTPVRESFIRLQREGLLDIYPQRGTYVSKISLKRIHEERFVRETLETAVFLDFMKNPSEKGIAQMKYFIEMQKHAHTEGDYYLALTYDNEFHHVAYTETDNGLAWNIVHTNSIDDQRVRLFSTLNGGNISELNTHQHEEICDAVIQRDIPHALTVLQSHLRKIHSEIDTIVEDYNVYFTD